MILQNNTHDLAHTTHSKSGHMAAIVLCITNLLFASWLLQHTLETVQYHRALVAILLFGFISMLIFEFMQRSTPFSHMIFVQTRVSISLNRSHFQRSVFWRYLALLLPWVLMNVIIQQHYYFQTSAFSFTRFAFEWIGWTVLLLGIPYIALTLFLRGHTKYEYNDYAILTLLYCRALLFRLMGKPPRHYAPIFGNRRSKKLFLSWLVTLFFLTLMFRFIDIEFNALKSALQTLTQPQFSSLRFFQQYHAVYLLLYHLIFVIDVSIAIIAYTVANRWLDNRVRSVDATLKGWVFALICYPPINSGFTGQFFGYDKFQTHTLVTTEWILMVLMALILVCFSIYVWATMTLGFKFSNLCHRGIVNGGPYQYLRHPAYTTKNIAWWLDNTYILSNGWAILAMIIANLIYITRGLTEEKHLRHDPIYRQYCRQVKGQFWPAPKTTQNIKKD